MIFYLIYYKPFKEENQQATTVADEFIILACVCMFITLYVKQDQWNMDKKKEIGWLIVLAIIFSVIKNFSVVVYFSFYEGREKLRELFVAQDEMIDSANTTGGTETTDTMSSVLSTSQEE